MNSFKDEIVLQGVRTHNLQNIDITLPKNKVITVTWVSGSWKSSLAFHTLYKEGQFRYIESLSSYLRQFFNLWTRPDLDYSSGLSPAIAIEQNKRLGNSRSTVGTLTEIDDYLRLLFAKLGNVSCYSCGDALRPKTTEQIVDDMQTRFNDQKVYMIQEIGVFDDDTKLGRWVRKNRRQVDQGGGVTRFLIETNVDVPSSTQDVWDGQTPRPSGIPLHRGDHQMVWERIEYFYLEDPKVPKKMLPVKVYGVFDRVTINKSTERRLKDDVIKMLWRSEKFGVMLQSGSDWNAWWDVSWVVDEGWWKNLKKSEESISSKKYRFILLHGYTGRPDKGWLPWMKVELEKQGHEVVTPALPKPDEVALDEKVQFVLDHGTFDERTILVGHSLGSVVAMKVAEKLDTKIAGFISVAGPSALEITDKKRSLKKFQSYIEYVTQHPKLRFQWKKIKEHIEDIFIIGSPTDPLVAFSHQQTLAKKLWVEVHDIEVTKWHVTGKEEPGLLEVVSEFVQGLKSPPAPLYQGGSPSRLWNENEEIIWYTDKYYCANCNIQYPEFTSQHFSANRQEGACERCHGIGEILQADFDKILDPFSVYLQAVLPWRDSNYGQAILKKLAQKYDIKENTTWKDLPDRFRSVVIEWDDEMIRVSTGGGKFVSLYYKGIEDVLTAQYNKGVLTVDFQAMLDVKACPICEGARLKRESLSVYIEVSPSPTTLPDPLPPLPKGEGIRGEPAWWRYNIYELQSMPIGELMEVMQTWVKVTDKPVELVTRITKPLLDRAEMITNLGLGYIVPSRKIGSLSGGEIQRLRLAKQLGNRLTGIIYVLDEPTIGLDEGEIVKVIASIKQLQAMGNTIVVVEHNDTFIKASDWVVEVGPGAGDFGGHVVFNGPYEEFLQQDTLTAQYIRGEKKVMATFDHTPSTYELAIKKASKHNLQGIDVKIKLWSFTIITWPSGAGKTTLMYHTLFNFLSEKQKWIQSRIRLALLREGLSRADIIQAPVMQRQKYEHLEQIALQEYYEYIGVETITGYETIENVLYVNQSSIGKTPRSCPATFVWVFDDIRKLYAGVTEAKMLAFTAGHFSFNSNKGACPECNGYGDKKIELQFLPDTYVPCSLCKGRRYKPEILDIRRHGKTISEVLSMYVKDAIIFFEDMEFIADKLQLMMDIGLGYLKMGQPAHTLSGGESQRLKLVKHLLKQYRGHTVYFLDEPTVGLHASDIERLLAVLKQFLDKGDTILMIEHEKNLLQFADKVIRLEAGTLKSK